MKPAKGALRANQEEERKDPQHCPNKELKPLDAHDSAHRDEIGEGRLDAAGSLGPAYRGDPLRDNRSRTADQEQARKIRGNIGKVEMPLMSERTSNM